MPRRKSPKETDIDTVIAASIKATREEREMTQSDLSKTMVVAGFDSWNHTTVRLVETAPGEGEKSRRVSLAELLELSRILKKPLIQFLHPDPWTPIVLGKGARTVEPQSVGERRMWPYPPGAALQSFDDLVGLVVWMGVVRSAGSGQAKRLADLWLGWEEGAQEHIDDIAGEVDKVAAQVEELASSLRVWGRERIDQIKKAQEEA